MPANWHSSSWIKSYVGHPSCRCGGLSFHPRDVPPFIFPQDYVPIPSGFVPHATALVASSLGGDLGLLATSSRCTSKVRACQVEATSISGC
jgi:hypothetical protein